MEIAAACVSPRFWAKRWNQRNFLWHEKPQGGLNLAGAPHLSF